MEKYILLSDALEILSGVECEVEDYVAEANARSVETKFDLARIELNERAEAFDITEAEEDETEEDEEVEVDEDDVDEEDEEEDEAEDEEDDGEIEIEIEDEEKPKKKK
jgi:hypothetical protein